MGVTTAFSEEGWEPRPATRPPAPQLKTDVLSKKTWTRSRDPHDVAPARRETLAATIPTSPAGCAGGSLQRRCGGGIRRRWWRARVRVIIHVAHEGQRGG
jgi:hypothetical protein